MARVIEPAIALEDGSTVSSDWRLPDAWRPGRDAMLVLAHGAGNDMHAPLLRHVQSGLAGAGIACVRFNFPYKEAGRRAPDSPAKLLATWRAVLARVRAGPDAPGRLFAGGKSMGGRIASLVAAEGEAMDGLVFLGYPLHPAGRPERLRTDHFPRLRVPCLFVEGTRDPLCDLGLLEKALPALGAPATLHVVEGGDHSFAVPKSAGIGEDEIRDGIVAAVAGWIGVRAAAH